MHWADNSSSDVWNSDVWEFLLRRVQLGALISIRPLSCLYLSTTSTA